MNSNAHLDAVASLIRTAIDEAADQLRETMKETPMDQEAISDLVKLEPYFASELEDYPSEFTLTAAMWAMLSQRVRDALEADLVEAGYELKRVRSASYFEGRLYAADVVIRQK